MWLRRTLIVLLLLCITIVQAAAAEDSAATVEAVPFFGGAYKSGQWLPIRVTVANDGPDRQAIVRAGSKTGASYDMHVELPRGARKALVLYVRPEAFARSILVRLLEGDAELAQTEVKVEGWTRGTEVIGILSSRPLTAPVPQPRSQQTKLVTTQLSPSDLPGRGEGLSSFSALVMDGAPLDNLSGEQATALEDWVRAGGQLLVGASEGERSLAVLPASLRIASPGTTVDLPVAGTVLGELGAEARIRATMLNPAPGATAVDALTIQQEWGRGRVTVVGFSLSDPALQQLPHETGLWHTLLRIREFDPNSPPDMTVDDMQAQNLTQALYNLPALSLPPLGVLAGLLIAYILLAGPVLYLVLWRLDRQAWAWVVIPVLTVLFSAGTYGYGMRIRGDDVILNQISIIQPAGDRARVRTYAGIFSPRQQTYDVSLEGDALLRPLTFDPQMWGGDASQSGGSGQYVQGSGAIRDLPVAQWSMTTFAAEGSAAFPAIVAEVELGDGVLRGTVRNEGTTVLRDVAIIQSSRAAMIGEIQPGAEKSIELKLDDAAMPGEPLAMRLFRDRWDPNRGIVAPELRLPVQIIDSLYSYNPLARTSDPLVIAWMNTSPISMRVDETRVHDQRLALVEVPVKLSYAESVTFPRGWMRPEYQTTFRGPEGTCMSQWGAGTILSSDTITATLRLPVAAQELKIAKATLYAEIEGPPPDSVVVEAYDWAAGTWQQQSESLGTIRLTEPGRFFSKREMRVRLQIPNAMMRGGCLRVDAAVGGTR